MSRRLGLRRPRVAGHPIPAGLVKATSGGYASGPTMLPGGATIPAGSQVTDATSMLGALQARTAQGINGATPLPRDQQYWALMGPGAPLFPAPLNIPNPTTGQADPRRFQYPVSWNIVQDAGRLVDWSTLRNAARDVDLIAQCIRVRRTEQSSLDWDITLTRRTIEAQGIKSSQDKNSLLKQYASEISRLIEFWSEPDTTNGYSWPEWVEMLIQEAMVTDAVSIFPRFTYGGDLCSLELIDGSTVKVLLDERGNRPRSPAAAYQQWLWGFPRGEYTDAGAGEADWEGTAGSLIYKPRYTRVESPYGYSPVEQALVSAELWLRRQQWMVAEYTSGTAPRMVLKSNVTTFTPEQLRAWEDSLNDYYGGSTDRRHRMRLFPDGIDPTLVDDAAERYKPDYDEFLVKLICAHMDVQPEEIGFTPRNGIGGAGHGEAQEAITYRKALRPTAQWLVGIMNQISYAYLGMPRDLTFQFLGLEDEDQDAADQTMDRQFRAGRITLNETRDRTGAPRFDFAEADMPMVVTQRGVVFLENASELVEPGEMVGPVQAPPLKEPEGLDAEPDAEDEDVAPVVQARRAKQAAKPAPKSTQDSGEQPAPTDAQKAEFAAYKKWRSRRRNDGDTFEFAHVTKALAEAANVDLSRVTFKAGGGAPKLRSGRTWPGWSRDLAVAKHWARALSRALTGAVPAKPLAQKWLSVRKAADAAANTTDAQLWLAQQGVPIAATVAQTLRAIHTEGYLVGQRSAVAMTADVDVSWDGWTPGHPEAAAALIGEDVNLERLLSDADVTITSIAQHRLDKLAEALADGLANGDSVDTLAAALEGVLDDSSWAYMVAVTETTRAVSYATLQSYMDNGIEASYWMTAEDERVCFPAGTPVATVDGDIPIEKVEPGVRVLTPSGPKTVTAAIARTYVGGVTVIFAGDRAVAATDDHPFWTSSGWVSAGTLREGDLIQPVGEEFAEVDRVVHFLVSDANDVPTKFREGGVTASVAVDGLGVPVLSVDLQRDIQVCQGEVNRPAAHLKLLLKGDAEGGEGLADEHFWPSLAGESAITGEAAKSAPCGRLPTKAGPARGAVSDVGRATTFLGAVGAVEMLLSAESASAASTRDVLRVDCPASHGTDGVSTSLGRRDREVLSADHAGLDDSNCAVQLVARSGAVLPVGAAAALGREYDSASATGSFGMDDGRRVVASCRAEDALAGEAPFTHEWFVALATRIPKWHDRVNLVRGDKPLVVYDIQVADACVFYASGLLVHNCEICDDNEDAGPTPLNQPFPSGAFQPPAHPLCRCALAPVL